MSRRAFVQAGAVTLLGAGLVGDASPGLAGEPEGAALLRFGLVTDLHYADKPPAGSRHYRETPDKLAEAAAKFAEARPAFTVMLGDLVDAADDVETERRWLGAIYKPFEEMAGPKHFVLGNHCVETLTKEEFLGGVGQERSFYSFDAGGLHFVVLDACFRGDGVPYGRKNSAWDDANVPADELDWLKADLAGTPLPTVVFAHQRLDGAGRHCVNNAAEVRAVLEEAPGRVLAVFQGHSHGNDYKEIGGVRYATLVAMVEGRGAENNGYALAEVFPGGTIRVQGFRKQVPYDWGRRPADGADR